MPNPFTTFEDLLEQLLKNHIDDGLLKQVIENQAADRVTLGEIKTAQETIKADLLSIKVWFNIPDARIVATQQQVDDLSEKITGETASIQQFDQTIPQSSQP